MNGATSRSSSRRRRRSGRSAASNRCPLPPVELATIVHAGSHTDIDRAYGALATYVSDRALGVDGPIRERYLVGRLDTDDETAWRTEIGWPIFHTGPVA